MPPHQRCRADLLASLDDERSRIVGGQMPEKATRRAFLAGAATTGTLLVAGVGCSSDDDAGGDAADDGGDDEVSDAAATQDGVIDAGAFPS
jgi:hypothetical protein